METPLGQTIERVVQAAGELTIEGTKLSFKGQEEEEVQVTVVEFDEEAKVFLARRSDVEGTATKAIAPKKFKLGMLNRLPSQKMAGFFTAWDEQVEPHRIYLVVPVISRAVPPAAKLIWTAHCANHNLEPCRYLPLICRPKWSAAALIYASFHRQG
jgi:hypothetical protein